MWILAVVFFTFTQGNIQGTVTVTDTQAQCEKAKEAATPAADKSVADGRIKGYVMACKEMQRVK